MDMLKQSALAFRNLLKYEYDMTVGSKKTLLNMTLFFSKEHFMHLIGLHKLTDLQIQRYSKERMYDMIIKNELTYDYIKKSVFFLDIKERIKNFPVLEEMLDSNELVIKYNSRFVKGTRIVSSFLIVYDYNKTFLHYFIDQDGTTGRYFGKSFFARNDDKFFENQQVFKVLKKIKYNKDDNTKIILINKPIKENFIK